MKANGNNSALGSSTDQGGGKRRVDTPAHYRLHHYVACWFAMLARQIPGDYAIAGVSFGASAKIIYEFVDFPTLRKTMHFPLDGRTGHGTASNYNRDRERVLRLFDRGAVKLHQKTAPITIGPLAFFLAIPEDQRPTLPHCRASMSNSPGGIYVSAMYGLDTRPYREALSKLRVEPLWLPGGEGVIIKPGSTRD